MKYEAIVIGASAGGLFALTSILSKLPEDFPIPLIIVQHRAKQEPSLLEKLISLKCRIRIKQADEKESILPGTAYFAPADYHLLVEQDHTLSLSFDPPVNYSRPSIDILFETASMVYKNKLLAIILTGASKDGAEGMRAVSTAGGTTLAQDPATALYSFMPQAAIDTGCIHRILPLEEIGAYLVGLGKH